MSKSWKIWPRGQQQEYASVRPSADSTEDEEAPFVRDSIVEKSRFLPFAAPQQSRLNLFAVFPWVLSLVLSLVSLFLVLNNKPDLCHLPNSFDRGWITDFEPARVAIETEQVWFSGTTDYNNRGELWIPHPSPVNYSGVGAEVDKAWEDLVWGAYFIISEEEAQRAFYHDLDELYNAQVDGYEIGLDMFHTLHCVDYLRKAAFPDHYPPSKNPMANIHMGHCIEQIRQYIMCAGDISPIPVKYHPNSAVGEKSYVYSDVPHTCRNFDKIQKWMLDRFHSSSQKIQDIIEHQ